jgi:hypothetical protein
MGGQSVKRGALGSQINEVRIRQVTEAGESFIRSCDGHEALWFGYAWKASQE